MIELLYLLLCTHVTIICVTLYLHRGQAHRGIQFNPIVEHFMRFWLWLTTGMITKEWVAVHRKHHRFTDQEGDPHSPKLFGVWNVLFKGAFLYNKASKDKEMVNTYGVGTPDDWMERNVYSKYTFLGILVLLLGNITFFGSVGIVIWTIQMIWIPFWAAGVINGIGHFWGYRNADSKDSSKNITRFGVIIGGEELHNNHHINPANPKLSLQPWEFDIGWMWLSILVKLNLAKLR